MKTQTWLIPLCLSGNKKQASKGRQNTVMSFPINHAYIKYIQTQQKKKKTKQPCLNLLISHFLIQYVHKSQYSKPFLSRNI